MKGMNIKDLEKEGYKEMEKIDLVNNKKEAMLVNILGIVIVVVMIAFIPLLIKAGFVRSYRDNLLLSLIIFSVSLAALSNLSLFDISAVAQFSPARLSLSHTAVRYSLSVTFPA